MSTPSLLNIPYLYKAGTLYSQIPESGAGDFTVTRATTPTAGRSTRINKDGLIELVADNVPRLDYPLGGAVNGCPALLVEPSGSNSMLYSQAINSWTKSELTITDNFAISPDGTQNASYIQQTTGGNIVNLQSAGVSLVSGQAQSVTFFAKAAQITSLTLRFGTTSLWAGSVRPQFTLNLTNGAVTLNAGTATVSSQNFGNGWYRYSIVTPATIASGQTTIQTVTNTVFSPNSGDGFYLWGVQWEQNTSTPTSYIPTTTAAVTRSADIVRKTNIASLIGQSEGTVYFEVEVTDEARNKWFFSLDSASNSFIQAWISPSRTINIQIQNNASVVMTQLTSSALSVGYHKVAFAYNTATNGCEMFIDGVQNPVASRTITGAGLPAFNNFTFGSFLSTQNDTLKAHVRAGALYPNRIPNTAAAGVLSLATLTAP